MTTDQTGPYQVHFTLLANGLDFVWSAIEQLPVATSKRGLKYAPLHLVSGIELILKERLRREDWKLLFPKPGKANKVLGICLPFSAVCFSVDSGAHVTVTRAEDAYRVTVTEGKKCGCATDEQRHSAGGRSRPSTGASTRGSARD